MKEERQRLGLNQSDFAALAQVAKNSQLNYEKDERSPDAVYLAAVAAVAADGVDVLNVVTGERKLTSADSIPADEALLLDAASAGKGHSDKPGEHACGAARD